MTHPINGLDDLIYIVMFGAHAVRGRAPTAGAGRPRATRSSASQGVEHLACRHADPAAALGAHERRLRAARPCRVRRPARDVPDRARRTEICLLSGTSRCRRSGCAGVAGDEGMRQRLEFGPGDEGRRGSSRRHGRRRRRPRSRSPVAISCSSSWRSGRWWWLLQDRRPADHEFVDLDVSDPTIVCGDADVVRLRVPRSKAGVRPRARDRTDRAAHRGPPRAERWPSSRRGSTTRPGSRPGAPLRDPLPARRGAESAAEVGECFAELWDVLPGADGGASFGTCRGRLWKPGQLSMLVGIGPNAFSLEGAALPLPAGLGPPGAVPVPRRPTAADRSCAAAAWAYSADVRENPATEEDQPFRAIADKQAGGGPGGRRDLEAPARPRGSGDRDGAALSCARSTSAFSATTAAAGSTSTDGVSNLKSDEREAVIKIDPHGRRGRGVDLRRHLP